ncbi:MAG: protein translocase subunit SecD [Acidobacteria bacterium]|nr:protein translocase subunit SecD [Acidobacteriota bacterium]
MTKRSLWRLILTLAICFGCGYFFTPLNKIRLGLDLRGGVHFELEVQGHEALDYDMRLLRDKVEERLQSKQVPGAAVRYSGTSVLVEGVAADQSAILEKALSGYAGEYDIKYEGTRATLTQKKTYQDYLKTEANKRALQIIENRVNQFGVAEPEITPSGQEGNRIVVELPGVGEAERERIKGLLSTPGRLELRMVSKGSTPRGYPDRDLALSTLGGVLPPDTELLPEPVTEVKTPGAPSTPKKTAEGKEIVKAWYLLENKVQFDGSSITEAHRAVDPTTEANEVTFVLDKKGADANYQVSVWSVEDGRYFAFVLDKKIVSVLSAREKIPGNAVRITGNFTAADADDLALKLKSGAMRASMKFLEEKSMGPSLGADSIRSGVRASLIGFLTIVAFMVFWYRWSGLNAIVALTVNVIVMLGLMGSFHAVITLPGIAGFALTIGMAVDANILIFERIREEMGKGKSVAGAIDAGFSRVFWTIVDSHVTQLFAALLLFIFGTGPVKGFAVSLTVGVVASLFTSIYISRFIYDWVLERHPDTKDLSIGTLNVFHSPKFDFMKFKHLALAISWGIILICIVAAQPWKGTDGRLKLGMQFIGGVDMMVRFKGDVKQEDVRAALVKNGLPDAAVVAYTGSKEVSDYSIKLKARKGQDEKEATLQFDRIKSILKTLDPQSGDARKDLNTAAGLELMDQWIRENPLQVKGDENILRATYEPLADRVIKARENASPMTSFDQLPKELPPVLRQGIEKGYRLGPMIVLKNESFSPAISGEWTWKTLQAVLWAMGAILVYVMFRFTMSFSVGGIVALIHDVLMALGLFVVFGFEFSVPVVASFLILIGYSMADTIVVFDRIRENSHKPEYRRANISKLVNDSINQTLSRTILTSLSVLFVAFCLFAFGGPALRDLAFPIFVGVITGTYSSIYIASPVVVYWDQWFGGKDKLKQHA